jgi:ArsR family transcriptional regulator
MDEPMISSHKGARQMMFPENLPDEEDLTEVTTFLKALAEPKRLRILAELMAGDSCNCELKDRLGMPPNLLSHHLRVLSEAGLVNSRKDTVDARWIYYTVDRATAARWQAWFSEFLDPARIQIRPVCGPEGQLLPADINLVVDTAD